MAKKPTKQEKIDKQLLDLNTVTRTGIIRAITNEEKAHDMLIVETQNKRSFGILLKDLQKVGIDTVSLHPHQKLIWSTTMCGISSAEVPNPNRDPDFQY